MPLCSETLYCLLSGISYTTAKVNSMFIVCFLSGERGNRFIEVEGNVDESHFEFTN